MGFFLEASLVVIVVSTFLVQLVRRNLRQRPMARRYREMYVRFANELVGDTRFPDAHAKQLVGVTKLPEGWLTRFMVAKLLHEMILGKDSKPKGPPFDEVPPELRAKYIAALLALAIADSYRCALLGRVWRGANLWVLDAVEQPKPDVNAHATRRVIEQVSSVRPRHARLAHLEECAA